MIVIERLEPGQFPILAQVAEGTVPDPGITIAIIAKDGPEIVGRMFLMAPSHVEGTWVHESHRKGTTGYRLLKRMEEEAAKAGIHNILAYSMDADVSDYLTRMGYQRTEAVVFRKELPCHS